MMKQIGSRKYLGVSGAGLTHLYLTQQTGGHHVVKEAGHNPCWDRAATRQEINIMSPEFQKENNRRERGDNEETEAVNSVSWTPSLFSMSPASPW